MNINWDRNITWSITACVRLGDEITPEEVHTKSRYSKSAFLELHNNIEFGSLCKHLIKIFKKFHPQ